MKQIQYLSLLLLVLWSSTELSAQISIDDGRYKDPVFESVKKTAGILYGSNIQATNDDPVAVQKLYLDVYEPMDDDPTVRRPVIILAFGGAFILGIKESPDIKELCSRFAKLGYVAISIDYRLTPELSLDPSDEVVYGAVMKGFHDMKAAVRFLRKDADTDDVYRIDTDQIYVGGVSAGAVVAMHMAYLDKEEEIPVELESQIVGQGGLEGVSGNPEYSSEVTGVISLSGGLGNVNWLEAGDIPLVSIHGTEDDVIPYGNGAITLLGLNVPFSGSGAVHEHAETMGLYHALRTFEGAGHTPFVLGQGASEYMNQTFDHVRDFLYNIVIAHIEGNNEVQVGINDQKANFDVAIYPNPTSTDINISIDNNQYNTAEITLYDLLGRTILQQEINANQTQLKRNDATMPAGIYYLSVRTQEGEVVKELIIE